MAKVLIQVSLEYKDYETIDKLSKEKNISKSEVIRQAVKQYLVNK